jgi:2-C-methyl-D-erythritol 4-phosphate cytidylyltransferase
MPNTFTFAPAPLILDAAAIIADARAARAEYEQLVNVLDGAIAPSTWRRVADELHRTGSLMLLLITTSQVPAGWVLTHDQVRCHVDRAKDADHNAVYAERMASAAREYRCVEVVS